MVEATRIADRENIGEISEVARVEMENFFRALESRNMDALWRERASGAATASKKRPYAPCHWRWSDIQPFLERAGELVVPGPDADRRVIQLINPSLPGIRSASHTLTANVQMVGPGETAPSHRHTNNAIRFIIEGESAVTVVNGEAIEMNPGDLVLTPGMHWHGHVNLSDGKVVWMDTLDRPLIHSLKQNYQEPYGASRQLEPVSKPKGENRARFGAAHMRPIVLRNSTPSSPLLAFPWAHTQDALHRLTKSDPDPFDDIALDFVNPTTGGHVLPTIGCRIQLLRPFIHTRAHRHSYASVFHVARGSGSTIVDGIQVHWKQGDFFVVPPQCWHEHLNKNADEAILFSTNDTPVLEALQLYEEEAYGERDGRQAVTSDYADSYGY